MSLSRTLAKLEAIAEEARMAPYRRLAEKYDAPLAEVLATADEARAFVDRLRARGLSPDEILARCARHWGIPLETLRRNCEGIAR